jgi:hypothetical protein
MRPLAKMCCGELLEGEFMKSLFTIVLSMALMSVAAAQQGEQAKPPAGGTQLFRSARQAAEMKKMVDSFAGIWKTTTNVYKVEGWFPQDASVKGRAEIHAGPAGNSIMERFRSTSPMGNFAGQGVYWWSKETTSYTGIWCDSMDPNGCGPVGKGAWEGDNLIFNNEINMGGPKMKIRETWSNIAKDSFDFMIETSSGDAPMVKVMTIHYERSVPKSPSTTAKQ